MTRQRPPFVSKDEQSYPRQTHVVIQRQPNESTLPVYHWRINWRFKIPQASRTLDREGGRGVSVATRLRQIEVTANEPCQDSGQSSTIVVQKNARDKQIFLSIEGRLLLVSCNWLKCSSPNSYALCRIMALRAIYHIQAAYPRELTL